MQERQKGLSPGVISFIGEKKTDKISIKHTIYSNDYFEILEYIDYEKINKSISHNKGENHKVHWINIIGLDDVEQIAEIGNQLSIHFLILEDIVNTEYHSKFTFIDNKIFIIIKNIHYDTEKKEIYDEHLALILAPNFVISFQEGPDDNFEYLHGRICNPSSRIRKKELSYLFYALLNIIIENYNDMIFQIGSDLENLEDDLIENQGDDQFSIIIQSKKKLVKLKRSIKPIREIFRDLKNEESDLIHRSTQKYINDLVDHSNGLYARYEELNDAFQVTYDIYSSNINIKLNEIIKVLTIISTVFIPLNFIASFYGMNFTHIPFLQHQYGIFVAIGLMTISIITLVFYLKSKKWF